MDVFFAPIFVHLPLPNAGAQTYTCPMAQGAPDMVGRALHAEGSPTRVLRPALFEKEGDGFDAPRVRRSISLAMRALADSAGDGALTPGAFDEAYEAALDAQRRFEAGLHAIGERTLRWARGHGYPVVLIAGETHVIHDAVLDAGIHELVAANGALPLPVDCYPMPEDVPGMRRVHWASAGQTLRATAAGAIAGDVYPLLLGAYGCGPNSMIEHLFDDLVEDWPHAVLESDGHGGKAGYVTRVQAFLHSVRRWRETAADGAAAVAGARRTPTSRRRQRPRPAERRRTTRPAPACRRASRASTGASRTVWTPATTASTSATWAAASAATSRRRCAAPGTTPPTSASPTPPRCAPPAPPAPARSACPTSSSGAASPASSTRRRRGWTARRRCS